MTGFLKKTTVCITALFLFCAVCIGFAQVSDPLSIGGRAEIPPQSGVFITDVSAANGLTVNQYVGTVLNSQANLTGVSSVTVNVTVYNNSDMLYGYNITKYAVGETSYDNENIQVTTTMQKKDPAWVVHPGGYLTFPVTYSYVKGASTANPVLNAIVEFEFLPWAEIPDNDDQTTVSNAMDRFQEILNTPTERQQLQDYMDNPPLFDRNSSYISNVPGAKNQDINAIEGLFEGNLHININGEQVNVKIMIKRENISNAYSGDEMVIYMTTDPLDTRGKAVVYRCAYANDNGNWIKLNEMQTGTATVCDYTFGSSLGTGSFNTNTWKAT